MIKFNSKHIVVGEIKQKLKSFNLPTIQLYRPSVPIYDDELYLKQGGVYKGSGGTLKHIKSYIRGEELNNLTKNLNITSNIYDSYTHRYLGDYLRFLRDYDKIDLMSMYNCFSNEMARNVDIRLEDEGIGFNSGSPSHKIYAVPIRWFNDYTISIEGAMGVEMVVGIYSNKELIICKDQETTNALYKDTYQKVRSSSFSRPFLYTKVKNPNNIEKCMLNQEKNLTLFIKVPANSTSSVVVLEGNYLLSADLTFKGGSSLFYRTVPKEVCNYERYEYEDAGEVKVNDGPNRTRKYITRPQLLEFNSTISFPFADRLIEYLFDGVITPTDTIAKNVERIQKRLVQTKIIPHVIKRSTEYSTQLRNIIYDQVVNSDPLVNKGMNRFDINGYVDKDTEFILGDYEEGSK